MEQSINDEEYEIIVIDDASKDSSKEVLIPFMNQIKFFSNKQNKGLPFSLNKGIKNATGQFIVRVDSDDYVHKDYLKILSMYLLYNKDFDAVACDYLEISELNQQVFKKNCMKDPIGCGIMFRTDNLFEIGLYDEDFKYREEEELRIRFLKKFNISRIPIPLYRYRQHENNITKNKDGMEFFRKKMKKKHN